MKLRTNILVKFIFSMAVAAGIFFVSSVTTFGQEMEEKPDAKLAKQAKITMEAARKIALKRAPGKVEAGELEKEKGKLVYSFDIRNAKGTISEVWVDAKTGKVVKVEEEDAAAESKEKQDDETEKP
ncbi:MAG: PepSY domain-containing protein [Pyrinomonadaceae bacterium]